MQKQSGKWITKSLAIVLAASFVATTALPANQAFAGPRKGVYKKVIVEHRRPHKRKKRKYVRRSVKGGELLAAGILGLAIGAIIADSARPAPRTVYRSSPRVVYRKRPYTPPRDSYCLDEPTPLFRDTRSWPSNCDVNPSVIRYEDAMRVTYEPWTPEWADWCDAKYRSFNRNTGTFRGYDGRDHFCVVK